MATAQATTRSAQNGTRGEGRGRVLAAAFDEAERQPALQEGREQALEQVSRGAPPHEVAAVVEADVGLTCAIVRAAGQIQGGGRIRSVSDAVERLGPGAVEAILRSAPSYDIFNGDGRLALAPDRFRLHALDVQRAAEAIERHHSHQAEGMAAVIRLADMIAAHLEDCPVSTQDLVEAAESCGL